LLNQKKKKKKKQLGYREEGTILLHCITLTVRNPDRLRISDRDQLDAAFAYEERNKRVLGGCFWLNQS
jgi:hypothetical protein